MKQEKNNKGIILLFIVIIILLGAIILLVTKNNNSKEYDHDDNGNDKSNIDTSIDIDKISSDSYFISIATSLGDNNTKEIDAFTNNGEKVKLIDITNYDDAKYTYNDGKLYLYLETIIGDDGGDPARLINRCTIGYINLEEKNNEFIQLKSIDDFNVDSIAAANNNIYLVSDSKIYGYNIEKDNLSTMDNIDYNYKNANLFTLSNEMLGYFTEKAYEGYYSVGTINLKTNTKKEISSNANFQFVYDNKIIYKEYVEKNNYSKWKYYEYNIEDENKKQISDTVSGFSMDNQLIVPFNNYYIFADNNVLYKHLNDNTEKLYEFDGTINNINLISISKLNIVYGDDTTTYGTFDLDSLDFNTNKNEDYYYDILYLK